MIKLTLTISDFGEGVAVQVEATNTHQLATESELKVMEKIQELLVGDRPHAGEISFTKHEIPRG